MFSWYKYLVVNLVFSHLGFWSGTLFLIAPFPDLCLLVLFFSRRGSYVFKIISLLVSFYENKMIHGTLSFLILSGTITRLHLHRLEDMFFSETLHIFQILGSILCSRKIAIDQLEVKCKKWHNMYSFNSRSND